LAKLGQERNQAACQYGTDPRHRGEQPVTVGECYITHDDLDQALVDCSDVGSKTRDAAARAMPDRRAAQDPDEIAPQNNSITSSARTRSRRGNSRFRASPP
jgi:hypothetical protein